MLSRARRRSATITAVGLLASLGLATAAGGASAARVPAQTTSGPAYSLSFSPNHPKYSSSLTLNISDSAQQPTSVTVALPAGLTLNSSRIPLCATVPTCEPATQVGSGNATVTYNGYVIPLSFEIFNRSGGLGIVINNPNGTPVTVLPTLSGSTLTIPYPDGMYKGLPIVVDKLSMTFNQTGSGAGAYIRTPSTCPKAGWSSTSTFTFGSAAPLQVHAAAKCSLVKKAKKKKKS
jgi:hypothetical protein